MAGPAVQAVRELAEISHLPASMNGNPFLYATTLTSMMCGAVLGLYVLLWMSSVLVRDRKFAGFKSVLFNFRLMMLMAGSSALLACLPEVLYLQMYGDTKVPEAIQGMVLTGKRLTDSIRVYFIIGWVMLLVMIHPYVSLALMDRDEHGITAHTQVIDYPGWDRLWKPAVVFMGLAVTAIAFTFSKVYG